MDEMLETSRLGSDSPQGVDSHARSAATRVLGQVMSGINTIDALSTIDQDNHLDWDFVAESEDRVSSGYET